MLFFDIKTFIFDINRTNKSHHFVENLSSFDNVQILIYFFFTDNRTGMNAKIVEPKI